MVLEPKTAIAPVAMESHPISLHGLYKHYGSKMAVRGIDLDVKRGELFGLIGPDGAGKTTTFHREHVRLEVSRNTHSGIFNTANRIDEG
jgi:ABC-2 type transport system ATP-binding protein